MSEPELRIAHFFGNFSLFEEWMVETDPETAWFVRRYKTAVQRRNIEAGDYHVEVFTSPDGAQPMRAMTAVEIALFKLALEHCSVKGAGADAT